MCFITCAAAAQGKTPVDAGATKVVRFYPNPATSVINFELPSGYDKSYSIQLFNFMGKQVSEITVTNQRTTFSLDGFYRGVYIYQLRDKLGKVIDSGRFQVVR